jgi:SAM-dependent methyltransferase
MKLPFDAHSAYYDLLYSDKDYAAETNYVISHLRRRAPKARRVLELGCGTGGHAEHLARQGYVVHGVDFSAGMLARAFARRDSLPPDVAARLSFSLGDVRDVRLEQGFDVAISLFHVMSYQCSNADLLAVYETAASHLGRGGVLLYDYWYGPAVLTQGPEVRVRRLANAGRLVTRITEPVMYWQRNVCDISITLLIEDVDSSILQQSRETHPMRYLFQPELALIETGLWSEAEDYAWMTEQDPDADHWAAMRVVVRS